MTENDSDGRSPIAVATDWASRIMTVSLSMVLPILGGYWIDERFKIGPVGVLTGLGLGVAMFGWQLFRLVKDLDQSQKRKR